MPLGSRFLGTLLAGALLLLLVPALHAALAAPPSEVVNLRFDARPTLAWDANASADVYHVYRGKLSELRAGTPPRCHGTRVTTTSFTTPASPASGEIFVYLVTAASGAEGEGGAGTSSAGEERPLLGGCEAVIANHILDRLGYGWSEWQRDRLEALGWQGYLDEQLAPESIDESGNGLLNTRLQRWADPENHQELVYLRQDRSIYTWRQLEQQATEFWQNHFTTYWIKTYDYVLPLVRFNAAFSQHETMIIHRKEEESFREQAFAGTFRDILEASALSPAMLIYLDTVVNVAGAPNENYAREVLELHALGVGGGYTQRDIEELARVFTGWEVCRKAEGAHSLADPCQPADQVEGPFVAHFNAAEHDPGQKILFEGRAEEAIIPDTSANPGDGANDVQLALDAIAAHPSTRRYISEKLLRRFITDNPSEAMIDRVVDAWQAHGGALREVLRAALDPEFLFDPDFVGAKLKTPQEQQYSAFRALRGKTALNFVAYNNSNLYLWLSALGHLPYDRVAPDGYPESGAPWITTNGLLSRQDMGLGIAYDVFIYHTEVNQMVADYGLESAEEIVDFFADILYGGAITPAERVLALDYLESDELGNPAPYDDARVRESVGFMLGFAQFNER